MNIADDETKKKSINEAPHKESQTSQHKLDFVTWKAFSLTNDHYADISD